MAHHALPVPGTSGTLASHCGPLEHGPASLRRMANIETLTASGAGVLLEAPDLGHPDFTTRLREHLSAHRFALIRDAVRTSAEAVELMGRFGPVNDTHTRDDGVVVVDEADDGEVFRSSHALPLHKDGLLTGFDVVLVGIFCIDFKEVERGRTYVSDANRALERMPAADLEDLRAHGVEGLAVDSTGYYRPEHSETWHRVPAFVSRPGRPPTLNLGLPHEPGEPESWRVRVAGVEPARSEEILASLRAALLHEDFTYHHSWREGDLLVMDNYEVLHGRESFRAARRSLANIQVLAS